MSTLFLGSGSFGLPILDRLASLDPKLVVGTVPDAPQGRKKTPVATVIKARALELGLPCHEVATLRREQGDDLLEKSGAKLCIVADFRLFLTKRFLGSLERFSYNFHPSLLPAYRGAAPVARALLAGEKLHGITLYRMVRAMDAGPVVDQRELTPKGDPDRPELEAQLSAMAADMIEDWLPRLLEGDVPVREQDESAATYAPILQKHEGWLDWRAPAAELHSRVRALVPWPRCFSRWQAGVDGKPVQLFIDDVLPPAADPTPALPPGTIRSVDPEGIAVACGPQGDQTIHITALQRPGKKRMTVGEFLRGSKVRPGDTMISDQEALS